ncbi:aldo/keto reductase [Candidatus Bathyarchaeota archaeon]|nr:aldo/keto reductase [Candidatus Bathyarchaeota archaeon]
MKYRRFGRLDWDVSVLGFGAMRLPIIEGDSSRIDEPEAIKMIRYAVDNGVNYIDTAYPYHGGNSEIVVGKALKGEYREKARVATKMPIGRVNAKEDLDKIFNEQLQRLQFNHVDFYLLHGLNRDSWRKTLELNVLDWAERQVADGRINHLGFSFHDEFEIFKEIVDSYEWGLCQIQYNYVDNESSRQTPGIKGLKYAASKGLAVIIMEPIKGGLLAVTPPKEVQKIWDEFGINRSTVEWALLWVWNHPEVSVALSGMSTMEQVIENIQIADRSGSNILTPKELEVIYKAREKYLQCGFVGCTGCRYCMPCPQGVSIPEILAFYNEVLRATDEMQRREVIEKYYADIPPEKRADACVKCGACEEKCPQKLPIRGLLSGSRWMLRPPQ